MQGRPAGWVGTPQGVPRTGAVLGGREQPTPAPGSGSSKAGLEGEKEGGREPGRGSRYLLSGDCCRVSWAAAASSRQSAAQVPASLMAGVVAGSSPQPGAHAWTHAGSHSPGLSAGTHGSRPHTPTLSHFLSLSPPPLSHTHNRGVGDSLGIRVCAAGRVGALLKAIMVQLDSTLNFP